MNEGQNVESSGRDALELLRTQHQAVLIVRAPDDGLHSSPIVCALDDVGRVVFSTAGDRVKVRYLRRDPRAVVCVLSEPFAGPWLQISGRAEIVELPDAMDGLVDVYRRIAGEPEDLDAYRAAQERQGRVLVRITPDRIGPTGRSHPATG